MSDAATAEKPLKMASPSTATRMWVVLQKLTRAHNDYSRAKDHATQVSHARTISELVTQLEGLADSLTETAEQSGNWPWQHALEEYCRQ